MPVLSVNLERKSYFDVWGTNIICTALCTEALITREARRTHMSFAEALFRRKLTAYAAGRSELMRKMWIPANVTKCFKTFCQSNAIHTVMLRKLKAVVLRRFKIREPSTSLIKSDGLTWQSREPQVSWIFLFSAIVGLFQVDRLNDRNNKK